MPEVESVELPPQNMGAISAGGMASINLDRPAWMQLYGPAARFVDAAFDNLSAGVVRVESVPSRPPIQPGRVGVRLALGGARYIVLRAPDVAVADREVWVTPRLRGVAARAVA